MNLFHLIWQEIQVILSLNVSITHPPDIFFFISLSLWTISLTPSRIPGLCTPCNRLSSTLTPLWMIFHSLRLFSNRFYSLWLNHTILPEHSSLKTLSWTPCRRRCTPCIRICSTISSELLSWNKLSHTLPADTMHTSHMLTEENQFKLIYSSQRLIHSTNLCAYCEYYCFKFYTISWLDLYA